jgi:hypothetical protein
LSFFSAAVLCSGVGLEVCLIGCLLLKGLWRRYPWFSFFVVWFVVRTLVLLLVLFRFPPSMYPSFYWTTDTIDVLLRFFVVVELVRHLFPSGSLFKVVFSRGFAVVVAALLMFAVSTLWSYQAYARSHSMRTAMERSSSFTQAVMTLGLLVAAHYYGIPLGRQLRAIAIAFGAWASIATANNAMIDLEHSFLPYWQIVRPLSFVVLVGAWTWALWREAPEFDLTEYPVRVPELSVWTEHWNRTQSAARGGKPS